MRYDHFWMRKKTETEPKTEHFNNRTALIYRVYTPYSGKVQNKLCIISYTLYIQYSQFLSKLLLKYIVQNFL